MIARPLITILMAGALAGCALSPAYERPALPVADSWPEGLAASTATSAAALEWREVYLASSLQAAIAKALEENRDLRVAALNIERARAQYRVQRASSLPRVDAGVSGQRARTPADVSGTGAAVDSEQYNASLGVTAFELDLFGRVRSLNDAALQSYLATAETRRAVQVSLINEVAAAWLTLAADQDLLALADETLRTRNEALDLTRGRVRAGAASELELAQTQTLVEQATVDRAAYQAQVVRDRNALRLLVGAELTPDLLPGGLDVAAIRTDLPAGLPSDVLVSRPDVLAAEHQLRGLNANIGAARAAFFPRIALTGSSGVASTELGDLFSGGGAWSFAPTITLPIFDGGANRANLAVAATNRDIGVAQYERTIQTAFREVADALADKSTIDARLAAQTRLLESATNAERLSRARYEQGVDSYLTLLDAQRTRYAAEQGLVSLSLLQAQTLAGLYKALGGGAGPSV